MLVIITCNVHRNSQLASAVFPEFHGVSSVVCTLRCTSDVH